MRRALPFLVLLTVLVGGGAIDSCVPGALNGSSDGRYHTCNYVTEDGVTEHLDAYRERCNP